MPWFGSGEGGSGVAVGGNLNYLIDSEMELLRRRGGEGRCEEAAATNYGSMVLLLCRMLCWSAWWMLCVVEVVAVC